MELNKELHEIIVEKMDGRTNRWLSKKTLIAESEISRILNGRLKPTEKQIEKINAALGLSIKFQN
jgi:ribosome-binding protein aMBF1 (putative translation factor)